MAHVEMSFNSSEARIPGGLGMAGGVSLEGEKGFVRGVSEWRRLHATNS